MLPEAVTMKLVSEIIDKLRPLLQMGKKIPQIVTIRADPDLFTFTEMGRATTTSKTYDLESATTTITITNPLDRDTTVKEISLVPNANFKTNGIVAVHVDERKVLNQKAVADWTDLSELIIKFNQGKRIRQKRDLKIAIKNDDASTSVSLTAVVTFGD